MPINVFGQGAVQTAYVSLVDLDLTNGDIILEWPNSYVDLPYTDPLTGVQHNVLAASILVNTASDNASTITLPNAQSASVGQNFIIENVGVSSFDIYLNNGELFLTIEPGISKWIQLVEVILPDTGGFWNSITFGAGNSSADPVALAGLGLTPIGPTLNTNVVSVPLNMATTLDPTYRSKIVIWEGASADITLPLSTDITSGFYVSFNNQGSSSVTILPNIGGAFIDGQPSLILTTQQSVTLIWDGINYWSLGLGQNQFAQTTQLNLDVSASVDVTLTPIQSASLIQNYTGALTSDITVFFPLFINNWIINNHTTGAFTLRVQLQGPLGSALLIPQGTSMEVYSNGLSLFFYPTSISLAEGSITFPSLSFSTSEGTGFSSDGPIGSYPDAINISIGGIEIGNFTYNGMTNTAVFKLGECSFEYDGGTNEVNIINGANPVNIFPALEITSGGTGETTRPLAINALLPTAVTAGTIIYWDGTNWVILAPGAVGNTLTIQPSGLPGWS